MHEHRTASRTETRGDTTAGIPHVWWCPSGLDVTFSWENSRQRREKPEWVSAPGKNYLILNQANSKRLLIPCNICFYEAYLLHLPRSNQLHGCKWVLQSWAWNCISYCYVSINQSNKTTLMTLINNQLNTTFQSYLGIMVAIVPTGVKDRLNCGLPKLIINEISSVATATFQKIRLLYASQKIFTFFLIQRFKKCLILGAPRTLPSNGWR